MIEEMQTPTFEAEYEDAGHDEDIAPERNEGAGPTPQGHERLRCPVVAQSYGDIADHQTYPPNNQNFEGDPGHQYSEEPVLPQGYIPGELNVAIQRPSDPPQGGYDHMAEQETYKTGLGLQQEGEIQRGAYQQANPDQPTFVPVEGEVPLGYDIQSQQAPVHVDAAQRVDARYHPSPSHQYPPGRHDWYEQDTQRYHIHNQKPYRGHRPRQRRHGSPYPDHHQIQVVASGHSPQTGASMSEQMQMMMMNQMMMQQMAAQQMQVAQMAALTKDTSKEKDKKPRRPKVNIKSRQYSSSKRLRERSIPVMPVVIPQQQATNVSSLEAAAMENWQEATIILCIAIVGLIYLVVSRNSKEEEKEAGLAAKHLVPKS